MTVSRTTILKGLGAAVAAMFIGAGAALAAQPQPWQLGLQPPATPIAEQTQTFHDILLVIITLITLFVLGLLVYVVVRFRESANPTPSKTTHNTTLEIAWTAIPVLILLGIMYPSMQLLYAQDVVPEADMVVKVTGRQWYWSYEYPDHGGFAFDSYIIPDEDIQEGQVRQLEVDNRMVVPVNAVVHVLVTASDVLHNWTVPAFVSKIDAVPGRTNQTWFKATKEGVYYGQCSELCGAGHGYMPIAVEVVSEERFAAWVAEAQQEFGAVEPTAPAATQLADRD